MAAGAAAGAGGAERGIEEDAILEVRLRMPVRHLDGELVPEPARIGGYFVPWRAPPWGKIAGTALIPTVCNILELRPLVDGGQRVLIDSDSNVFAPGGARLVVIDLSQG